MRLAIAFVLVGCNQVFGLQQTQPAPEVDAQFFDAAPFGCPSGRAPSYTTVLHQDVLQNARDYTFSVPAGLAMAWDGQMVEGPLDKTMHPSVGLPSGSAGSFTYDEPRLAPEGDLVTLRRSGTNPSLSLYRRVDGKWTLPPTLVQITINDNVDHTSSITRGPQRHIIISNDSSEFHEYEFDVSGAASAILPFYTASELGLISMSAPTLSADGLHLVLQGTAAVGAPAKMYFTERPDLGARFTTAQPLAMPVVDDAFITEDCSRIYFSGLDSIWFVQEPQ